jgi:hypothetical protein
MPQEFDDRIVRVGLELAGEIVYYEGLYITAQGTRFGSDVNNECQIRINNMTRAHRDYILRETSPYFSLGRPHVHVKLEAGRQSYGTTLVYSGMVTKSFVTQPPDIGIILNCLTCFDQVLNIVSYNTGPQSSVRSIAEKASTDLDVNLNFQATDKQVTNFTMSNDALYFTQKLSELGDYDVTIDNETLIVKDKNTPLEGPVKTISKKTGMIGIPELTESGILVKFLLDNNTALYQTVYIESEMNSSLNGHYQLFKLGFDISSRTTPFYWIAECTPMFGSP